MHAGKTFVLDASILANDPRTRILQVLVRSSNSLVLVWRLGKYGLHTHATDGPFDLLLPVSNAYCLIRLFQKNHRSE